MKKEDYMDERRKAIVMELQFSRRMLGYHQGMVERLQDDVYQLENKLEKWDESTENVKKNKEDVPIDERAPKSSREMEKIIYNLIWELVQLSGEAVPIDELKSELKRRYPESVLTSSERVDKLLSYLKKHGVIFEPNWGYLKTV
jgi:DNA replicative helicase MCM subunit Mcm2 (Cdc46/Mcm family)